MSIYEMKWLVLVGLDQGDHIAEDMDGFNTRKEARVYAKELKESFSAMAKRDCENGKPPRRFDVLSSYLKVKGKVIPVSDEVVSLYATMDDDCIVKGEKNIPSINHHVEKVYYDHDVKANSNAIKAIKEADIIIYGIGSLFTSILPVVIIKEVNEALHNTKSKSSRKR